MECLSACRRSAPGSHEPPATLRPRKLSDSPGSALAKSGHRLGYGREALPEDSFGPFADHPRTRPSWCALGRMDAYAARVAGSPQHPTWKAALRQSLIAAGVQPAAQGPLEVVIAWRCDPSRRAWWEPVETYRRCARSATRGTVPSKPIQPGRRPFGQTGHAPLSGDGAQQRNRGQPLVATDNGS